ncbi:MAG: hypothetical protein R2708_03385 [Vicinamibacterales bacterium]
MPQALAARVDTLQIRPVSVNHAALAAPMLDIELTSGRVVRAKLDRREISRRLRGLGVDTSPASR